MIDFEWKLRDVLCSISRGKLGFHCQSSFLSPHENIWPENDEFTDIADQIHDRLDFSQGVSFLSVCLASYLLNPQNAPAIFPAWVQGKIALADIFGLDLTIDWLLSRSWGRAAFPLGDVTEKSPGRIVHALVGCSGDGSDEVLRYPSWVCTCLGGDSLEAVEIAVTQVRYRHPHKEFFFWPLLDHLEGTRFDGKSLGLPLYLSFMSLAVGSPVPAVLATGALSVSGELQAVNLLEQKRELARMSGFKTFLYPLLDDVNTVTEVKGIETIGVSTIRNAERVWKCRNIHDPQQRLLISLEPFSYSHEINRLLRDFTGRLRIIGEIDRWVADAGGSKILWITGGPGMGKSALSAWLSEYRAEYIAAHHFCDFNYEENRDPARLVCSLAYQLAASLPEYCERLKELPIEDYRREYSTNAHTLLDKLLIQPLADNFTPPDRSFVILIDALDEATHGEERRNDIALVLSQAARKGPMWLRFLITSRLEPEIEAKFYGIPRFDMETGAENRDDIAAYLEKRLCVSTQDQRDAILARSGKNFLYARHICDAIKENKLSLDRLDELPPGISGFYHTYFQRQFRECVEHFRREGRTPLCLITAACEPMPVILLQQMLGFSNEMDLNDCLERLGSLFPTRKQRKGSADVEVIAPSHLSLVDWLTRKECSGPYWIDSNYGHSLLADYGWKQYQKVRDRIHPYLLAWLPTHLVACGRSADAVRFLKDFDIMMTRAESGLLERMLSDYRENPSDALGIEGAFFRANAHILRRGNDVWPAHKILLQLAIEHADESSLSQGAEVFLHEEKCKWAWLGQEQRPENVYFEPCLTVFEGHDCRVTGFLQISDNLILSWSQDHTLIMWDQYGTPLKVLKGHTYSVWGALLLPDKRILSWSEETLRLWDQEGAPLRTLEGHSGTVMGASLLQDGKILSWSEDGTLRLWDQEGLPMRVLEEHTGCVRDTLFFPDGRILSWSRDSTLRVWDQEGNQLGIFEGHTDAVVGALILSDGCVLSWSDDSTLRLWNQNGTTLRIFEGHTEWVSEALLLPSGQILSWGGDCTLRLWEPGGKTLKILRGHTCFIFGALLLPDGCILSWSEDCTLRKWGENGSCLKVFKGHFGTINGAQLLPDGNILSWSKDGTLRKWDQDGLLLQVYDGHFREIEDVLQLSNGHILTRSMDTTLCLWKIDVPPGKKKEKHLDSVEVSLLPDGNVLSWSVDGTLRLWEQDGTALRVLEAHHPYMVDGAIPFSNGRIISWSWNMLCLWDRDGVLLKVLEGHSESIEGVLILKDERILSWSKDKTLRLWDCEGFPLKVLRGHTKCVGGALPLSDGRILSWSGSILGESDNTLRLWDSNGKPLRVLKGHRRQINGALQIPDGRILSWSGDGTVRLWDRHGKPLKVMGGHNDWIWKVVFRPDEGFISWSSNTVILWDKQGELLKVLENAFGWSRPSLDFEELALFACSGQTWMEYESKLAFQRQVEIGLYDNRHIASHSLLHSSWNTAFLECFRENHESKLQWHGRSICDAQYLFADGRAIISQGDGQVCFLRTYIGNRRATIVELEQFSIDGHCGRANS